MSSDCELFTDKDLRVCHLCGSQFLWSEFRFKDEPTLLSAYCSRCQEARKYIEERRRHSILLRDLLKILHAKCAVCGSEDALDVDHVIKIKEGGGLLSDNIQVLCHLHHIRKDRGLILIPAKINGVTRHA